MNDRDMMYGGYYQNLPGNMMQYNFGYQGMPGSLLNNGMLSFPNPNIVDLNDNPNSLVSDINKRLNSLENRVKKLEQKLEGNESYKDDNSMYMI